MSVGEAPEQPQRRAELTRPTKANVVTASLVMGQNLSVRPRRRDALVRWCASPGRYPLTDIKVLSPCRLANHSGSRVPSRPDFQGTSRTRRRGSVRFDGFGSLEGDEQRDEQGARRQTPGGRNQNSCVTNRRSVLFRETGSLRGSGSCSTSDATIACSRRCGWRRGSRHRRARPDARTSDRPARSSSARRPSWPA